MTDAASALALMVLPGSAGATAAGKAAGADVAAGDGFAALMQAVAGLSDGVPPETAKTGTLFPGIKAEGQKADGTATDAKTSEGASDTPSPDCLAALALLPLPAPAEAPGTPLSAEAKTALIAAAQSPTSADGQPPAVADDAKPAADGVQTPPSKTDDAGAETAGPATSDKDAAAKDLAQVTVSDLLPPAPILADPAAVLGDARKSTEIKAASGQAQGTKTDVLAAARDLIAPSPAPETPTALSEAAERKPTHAAQSDMPASELPRAKSAGTAPHAAEAAQTHAASQSRVTADAGPAQDTARVSAQSAGTPQADRNADGAAPAQTGAAGTPVLAHADARPPAMTLIRAETHAGTTALPVEQIAVTVARQFRQGTNRFEIRLDPPELGRIDVRLDLGHNGRAAATLTVERPETFHLLSRDARALEQMLTEAGVRTDSGSLNFALRDQSGRHAQQQDQGQGNNQRQAPENTETREAKAPLTLLAILEPGRLDLRV